MCGSGRWGTEAQGTHCREGEAGHNVLVEEIKKNFVTAVNNPQKINPAYYLSVDETLVDEKTVLRIYIP